MRKYNLLFCLVSLSTAVMVSCSDSSGQNCVPGDVKTCPCLGGTEGVQNCADDGSGWEACQCPADDGGDEDAGSDGNADDGDGGAEDDSGDSGFDAGADDGSGDDGGGDDGGGDVETDTDTDGGDEIDADDDGGGGDGDAATCQIGSIEYQDCGTCGWQTRNCVDPGVWEDWSICTEEGPCLPPATQDVSCGNCGTQAQECRSQCSANVGGYCVRECWWEDVGRCADQGSCSPLQARSCDLCGTESCLPTCEWGRCNYASPGPAPDQFETNDTEAQETYLGEVSCADDSWHTTTSYTNINPAGDVDHFRIRFNDDASAPISPQLRLTVPVGHTLEINTKAECVSGDGPWTTTHQYAEGSHAFYVDFQCCSMNCFGDDSLNVHVWISAIFSDSCNAYTLEWRDD